MVSGALGDAAAGLAILERSRRRGTREAGLSAHERSLVRRFRRPEPRLAWGARLARSGSVTAAMDVSDGLWRSARILAEASGVGFRIDAERLPLSPALRAWSGRRAREYALVGGEDYEILFTADAEAAGRFAREGAATIIGRATPTGRGTTVWENGKPRGVPSGFEHFDAG
jgi:thiamine-monophosphate kinase